MLGGQEAISFSKDRKGEVCACGIRKDQIHFGAFGGQASRIRDQNHSQIMPRLFLRSSVLHRVSPMCERFIDFILLTRV